MGAIRILPEEVANKIAAGEVVERPASVVKELVENSLDAAATRIRVEIEEGGLGLIRISDDGSGIAPPEVPLALARHGTSKLATAEDLWEVRTLGFRGEALPSIASVSRFELVTRRQADLQGTRLWVEGGVPEPQSECGCSAGTTITVRDLFFNTPARRKFLKTASSEGSQVATVVTGLALSHPEVAFTLCDDGRELFATPGRGGLSAAAAALLGTRVARELLPVAGDSPFARVTGLVGSPGAARANRAWELFFLNGRVIQSRMLAVAVEKAYGSLLPLRRFPLCLVSIEADPGQVDVNVHPTKREVRFRHESEVFRAVSTAVAAALQSFPRVGGFTASFSNSPSSRVPFTVPTSATIPGVSESRLPFGPSTPVTRRSFDEPGVALNPPHEVVAGTCPPAQSLTELSAEKPTSVEETGFRYVGQVFQTYLVLEREAQFVLVDQHAAHERVIFDALSAGARGGQLPVQSLLLPETIEFGPAESLVVLELLPALAEIGIEMEEFGQRTFLLRGVPILLTRISPAQILTEAVAEIAASGDRVGPGLTDRLLATTSCRAAIKAGETLSDAEAQGLLTSWLSTSNPWTCPHGRPVSVAWDKGDVARRFLRSGGTR